MLIIINLIFNVKVDVKLPLTVKINRLPHICVETRHEHRLFVTLDLHAKTLVLL